MRRARYGTLHASCTIGSLNNRPSDPIKFSANPLRLRDFHDRSLSRGQKLSHNLDLVFLQAGDLRTAEKEFRESLRLKPGYAEAHYNLALALHQDNKEQEVRAEFEKAFEIAPELRNAPRP
jgi:Tfp pilus assembly protein PilF